MRTSAGNTPLTLRVLCDAHDGIERATSSDELRVQIQKFATGMGFEHFAYVLMLKSPSLKAQQYVINGFPLEWMQKYVSRNYFAVDPVIKHVSRSTLPILWSRDDSGDESGEFWEEARSYGLQTGLSFAVHDRPGVTGVFSLATDSPLDVQRQDLAALIGRAQLFASLLHQAVTTIALRELVPEEGACLTARELECLKWAADGKTAWEIGRILGITERTAVFHMNNVMKKLGATNKIQAIVRAAVLKLL
jgi:LuxR family transcriptional activator of bioluminescence operon